MGNETLLDRATYKKIKSFDRVQMDNFIKDIYKSAAEETSADIDIDMDMLRKEIGAIKGVGESRLNEIMAVINKFLNPPTL